MCLLKTVIQRFLWGLIPSPEPGHCLSACLCVTGISVCMCVFVHECWRKSKALFPMRVIIPGWGGGWSRAGLPLHQRVFSSNTVVQAHGWPGLFLHVCAPERERKREPWQQESNFSNVLYYSSLPVWWDITKILWEPVIVATAWQPDGDANNESWHCKSSLRSGLQISEWYGVCRRRKKVVVQTERETEWRSCWEDFPTFNQSH